MSLGKYHKIRTAKKEMREVSVQYYFKILNAFKTGFPFGVEKRLSINNKIVSNSD